MATVKTILIQHGWQISDSIGEGGQATVYRATREGDETGTRYAVKPLRGEQGKQSYERFHREIDAIKKVDHPGVVKIVDHGSDEKENLHYYVMEYIDGSKPLKKIVGSNANPFYKGLRRNNLFNDSPLTPYQPAAQARQFIGPCLRCGL